MAKRLRKDWQVREIGRRLRALRIERGYSSYETFAIEHSLNRLQVWRMEKGVNFKILTLIKILEAYNTTVEEFFKMELPLPPEEED